MRTLGPRTFARIGVAIAWFAGCTNPVDRGGKDEGVVLKGGNWASRMEAQLVSMFGSRDKSEFTTGVRCAR